MRIEPLARSHRLESPDRGISISHTFRRRSDWRRLTVTVMAATRFNCCRDGINRLHNRNRIPPPPVNVAPMTAQAAPALPAVFRGCWQGQVSELDWIRSEPGAHKIGFWTPKNYRLCYKRVGNQPFTLTFTEAGVEPNEKIINARGHVVPISTDGRAYASMRSRLNFDEYKTRGDGFSPTFAVDEVTNLDCRIAGDDMIVSADVYGARDGAPWFRAHWRADFHKFEN